jgi:origin recognition complex subunit 6
MTRQNISISLHPSLSIDRPHPNMSRASIEQALTGLIPTLNGPLPLELVDIALSLLARSRSVAHSLKPDEEIARPYACAQLACER